jgi:hypothetical protein
MYGYHTVFAHYHFNMLDKNKISDEALAKAKGILIPCGHLLY